MNKRTFVVAMGCVIWPFASPYFLITVPGGKPQYYLDDDVQYFPAPSPSNSQFGIDTTGRDATNTVNP
ncbi:MAG: hypothetical protein MUD03_13135 [Pirellula sp.]|nr:hypothetical protein [Pirellula sp.]